MNIVDFSLIKKAPIVIRIEDREFSISMNYRTSLMLMQVQNEAVVNPDPVKASEALFDFCYELFKKSDPELDKEWLADAWQTEYFAFLFNEIAKQQEEINAQVNGKSIEGIAGKKGKTSR